MAEDKKDKELKVYFPFEDKEQRPLLIKIIDGVIEDYEKELYNSEDENKKRKTA